MSVGSNMARPSQTMRDRNWPTIRQFVIFVENRVGQLLDIVRRFEGTKVRVAALSIVDSVDYSVIRIVLTHPEQGRELLERTGIPFLESDVIAVQLPAQTQPMIQICKALLQAEVNIHYSYPLMVHPHGKPAVALHVDNLEMAMETLEEQKCILLREADLTAED